MSKLLTAGVWSLVGLAVLSTAGCGPEIIERDTLDIVKVNYQAVDCMLSRASVNVPRDGRILVATFVDVADVTGTSTFGRMLGETAAARLSQRGHNVLQVNLRRDSIVINEAGQFALSRDIRELGRNFDAAAVLVGTYTRTHIREPIVSTDRLLRAASVDAERYGVSSGRETFVIVSDTVYVSMRLVNANDNTVIAAHDYRVLLDQGVESLLTR